MTVVAWDGRTLAADKRACNGTLIHTTTKIFRVGGALAAYSGPAAAGEELLAWFRDGAVPAELPESQRDDERGGKLLVIDATGIRVYEGTPYPLRFEGPHFAIGCGRDFAMAAMYLGKTAAEAVAVACALDSGCGNGIDTLELTPCPS